MNSQAGVIVSAAFKRDLEFPAQVLVVLVAYQIAKQSVGVRLNIEDLCGRSAGTIAGSDVADRVPAGFAGSDTALSQEAEEIGNFFELHVVLLQSVQS